MQVCGWAWARRRTSASSIWPLRRVQPQPTSDVMPVSPGRHSHLLFEPGQKRRTAKWWLIPGRELTKDGLII